MEIADYNPRSRRAFEKNGYMLAEALPQREGSKASVCYDVVLAREMYDARHPSMHSEQS